MVNPYNHQDHLYSKSQPENLAFLERLRALCDEYEGRACLGEVGDAQRGLEIMGQYTDGDKRMHMCYAFEFLESKPATADFVKDVMDKLNAVASNAWACWAFSNHDVKRHASRWNLSEEAAKTYATLMMCLRGSACLYQGEELGLQEADVPFEALQAPYGIEFCPEFKGRDGCRTPMVWQAQDEFAGFGSSKPWLPVSEMQAAMAADRQQDDPESMLNHYRRAIALRQSNPALATGDQLDLAAENRVLSFTRKGEMQTIFCAFNLSDAPSEVTMPAGAWTSIGGSVGAVAPSSTLTLAPWQCVIATKQG